MKDKLPILFKRKNSIQVDMIWTFVISMFIALIIIAIMANLFNRYSGYRYIVYLPYFNVAAYILAFIVSFFILTRRVVTYLRTLEEGLSIIAEGNLSCRVPILRKDEIGRVASSINLMTEKLEKQIQKERDIEKSKLDLITGVSHDLRTPLTSIIGYLDLLRTGSYQNKDEYDRFVKNTYSKAIHFKKIIR
ncbi:HAMP domain-containing protein [Paenibacillus roseipurpureus]|uniref:HAMP domain-containing protein n=1 Tax=Paenibacillus roseopurpureus TaxID=2918901 RepID=UPI0028E2CF17|nr:HAMP domain-containing protein [Paenibacillus sp. MBLB1832]